MPSGVITNLSGISYIEIRKVLQSALAAATGISTANVALRTLYCDGDLREPFRDRVDQAGSPDARTEYYIIRMPGLAGRGPRFNTSGYEYYFPIEIVVLRKVEDGPHQMSQELVTYTAAIADQLLPQACATQPSAHRWANVEGMKRAVLDDGPRMDFAEASDFRSQHWAACYMKLTLELYVEGY